MKLTVYHDGQFWIGVIEHEQNGKLKAGRLIFGAEPKDQEVLEFVNGRLLAFVAGLSEEVAADTKPAGKINPKRLARQVSRELQQSGVSTYAQTALQLEYEKRKKAKQIVSRQRREEMKELKWEARVAKAKNKHRGR